MIDELATAWAHWMIPVSLHVGVLAALCAGLDRLLRGRLWPDQLHLLWAVVLLRLVLPVGLGLPAPEAASGIAPALPARIPSTPFVIWLTGLALILGGGGVRYWRYQRRILRDARVEPSIARLVDRCTRRVGVGKRVTVLVAPGATVPLVLGIVRPVVVLPSHALDHREAVEPALLHEMSHVRRRDPWAGVLCAVLSSVFWFHPLVWLTVRRLAELREEACDRRVATLLAGWTESYRRSLLFFAARAHGLAPFGSVGLVRRRSALLVRLDRLAAFHAGGGLGRRLLAATATLALLACAAPRSMPSPHNDFADLAARGCLPLRYRVLGMLAQEQASKVQAVHSLQGDSP